MCVSSQDIKSFRLNDITPLFYAISRTIPPVGAITSFANAAFDLYDLFSHLFKQDVKERSLIVNAAFFRFCSNMLLGFGNLAPILSIAAIMTFHPLIIPIIALHPVYVNFKKNLHMLRAARRDVIEKKIIYLAEPTKQNLEILQNAKDTLYAAKQEFAISTGLVIGTALSLVGVFFPPVLLAGIIFSVSISALGILDKRYQFTKKMHHAIFGADEDEIHLNTTYLRKGGLFPQPNHPKIVKTSLHPSHF